MNRDEISQWKLILFLAALVALVFFSFYEPEIVRVSHKLSIPDYVFPIVFIACGLSIISSLVISGKPKSRIQWITSAILCLIWIAGVVLVT